MDSRKGGLGEKRSNNPAGAINAVGHTFGKQPYENSATNMQSIALFTGGEGLHNNHHAAPTSAKLAHRWFEIDWGWYVIKVLTWMRLARVRLTDLRLTNRPRRTAAREAA